MGDLGRLQRHAKLARRARLNRHFADERRREILAAVEHVRARTEGPPEAGDYPAGRWQEPEAQVKRGHDEIIVSPLLCSTEPRC